MPNLNAPKGLVPTRHLDGSAWNGQVQKVIFTSSDATAVFIGDVVKYVGSSPASGTVMFGENVAGLPIVDRVTVLTANAAWAGVVTGFKVNPENLMLKHRAASTNRIGYICNDPSVVYEVQEDADTTPIAPASINLNANLTYPAGNSITGVSGIEIDSTTVSSTATFNVKVLGLVKREDNDFNALGTGTDKAKFEVVINQPLATAAGTAGT
jgi:hypothetical protein